MRAVNVTPWHVQCKTKSAFSLVEVVFALAIISTACILLIGLLAGGLTTFSRAVQTSAQAQILERISNDLKFEPYNSSYATNLYFDDQGGVISSSVTNVYSVTVTTAPIQIPSDSGAFTIQNTNVATKVIVVISKKAQTPTTNTMIWCNTGT